MFAYVLLFDVDRFSRLDRAGLFVDRPLCHCDRLYFDSRQASTGQGSVRFAAARKKTPERKGEKEVLKGEGEVDDG